MATPEPRRRPVVETPAQRVRQAEIGAELTAIARTRHPERYAPDGTALIGYAGATWDERLASWQAATSPHAPEVARQADAAATSDIRGEGSIRPGQAVGAERTLAARKTAFGLDDRVLPLATARPRGNQQGPRAPVRCGC